MSTYSSSEVEEVTQQRGDEAEELEQERTVTLVTQGG